MARILRFFTILALASALIVPTTGIEASAAMATQYDGHRGKSSTRPETGSERHGKHPGYPGNHRHNCPERPPQPPRPTRPPQPPRYHRPHHPIHIPARPYGYVPRSYAPVINSVLGLRFGISVANSIALLSGNGYTINYYDDYEVCLRNVSNMNYLWDNAILQYSTAGGLSGVCFYYSSPIYDISRYSGLYNTLCGQFGSPATSRNVSGVLHTSWFDKTGNNFITLSFGSGTSSGSGYCTTLSFGTGN